MSFMGEAIDTYHALLDDDGARETQLLLDEAQRHEGLFFGVRPIVSVLRPHFLSDAHLALLDKVCKVIAVASRQTVEYGRSQPLLWNRLAFTPAEQAVMDIDPGYAEWSVSSRLDSFLDSETDTLHFVEYNAESPAAIAYGDVISDIFFDLPLMRAFQQHYTVEALPARSRMLQALLDAYREWGGTGEPRIAIVDWRGLPTHSEFVLFQRFFTEHGIESVICSPEDLSYDGTTLRAGDRPIDLVYKRVLTSEFLERTGDHVLEHPLVRAYRDHKVCVANNFRAKLLHKKSTFALISDEAVTEAAGISAADRELLARHIPWTRYIERGPTLYQGQEVDLLSFIRAERDHLVLKPNDDYGGAGVKIGWETDADEWEQTIALALEQPFVVQDRVNIAYEPYPMLNGERLHIARRLVDTDPYLFGTDVQGCLTRLSSVTLLNVTAGGGSTVPTMRLAPRDASTGIT
jgi:hypothetical protein